MTNDDFTCVGFGDGLRIKVDSDDGELWVEAGKPRHRGGTWIDPEEARALRDWLVANVKD